MSESRDHADDGYDGRAELLDGERGIAVAATLRGQSGEPAPAED
jgi:hypothetical protein